MGAPLTCGRLWVNAGREAALSAEEDTEHSEGVSEIGAVVCWAGADHACKTAEQGRSAEELSEPLRG